MAIDETAAHADAPQRLLSTDFLNPFVEIACVLDMAPDDPGVISSVSGWQGGSYEDYFSRSANTGAGAALQRFAQLDPALRLALARETEALNALTGSILSALRETKTAEERAKVRDIYRPKLMIMISRFQALEAAEAHKA